VPREGANLVQADAGLLASDDGLRNGSVAERMAPDADPHPAPEPVDDPEHGIRVQASRAVPRAAP
jgi:hypothetical protein